MFRTDIPINRIIEKISTFENKYYSIIDQMSEKIEIQGKTLNDHHEILRYSADRREMKSWIEDLRNESETKI